MSSHLEDISHATSLTGSVGFAPLVYTEAEAARFLTLSASHLQRMRLRGDAPPHIAIGSRRIGYRLDDMNAWLKSRRVASTSELLPDASGQRKGGNV